MPRGTRVGVGEDPNPGPGRTRLGVEPSGVPAVPGSVSADGFEGHVPAVRSGRPAGASLPRSLSVTDLPAVRASSEQGLPAIPRGSTGLPRLSARDPYGEIGLPSPRLSDAGIGAAPALPDLRRTGARMGELPDLSATSESQRPSGAEFGELDLPGRD